MQKFDFLFFRYPEKTLQQSQLNLHHRNYELDLERDHALPTSAPNADILKSNNNPTYPNPNRHHNHDREKHPHLLNSTSVPSLPNVLKRTNGQSPTIPMFSGDLPSYSPPARSFFTPPLPPEYQHPFADKPTLRGTSNEGAIILNAGAFINRRPIPPPSLMPGHERIPFRPPDLTILNSDSGPGAAPPSSATFAGSSTVSSFTYFTTVANTLDTERKKALNTPSKGNYSLQSEGITDDKAGNLEGVINSYNGGISNPYTVHHDTRKEVLPSIRRILSGSNGRKGEIPEVLLKHVTSRPNHQSSSSPTVLIDSTLGTQNGNETHAYSDTSLSNSNINISINMKTLNDGEFYNNNEEYNSDHQKTRILSKSAPSDTILAASNSVSSTPSAAAAIEGDVAIASAVPSPAISTTFTDTDFSFPDTAALLRPLTVVVGCGVHVILCITLHYVEFYTVQNHQQHSIYQQQQQALRRQQIQMQHQHFQNAQYNPFQYSSLNQQKHGAAGNLIGSVAVTGQSMGFSQQTNIATSMSATPPPPRVLSLICQIIYIFVCFSLGLLYLYLYRVLKRILRSKSQNYIHGYQNLSYAIHITIATALLFVLLATLQIFGAISISTTRPLITQANSEIDWLQWGYQFSLRLIEIAIITLISWVTGLKNSGGGGGVNIGLTNGETQLTIAGQSGGNNIFGSTQGLSSTREKQGTHPHLNHSNVAGFFLPCTSSSSQEHFETDYPVVCNANTNLHTYTMRTGKLIYDDSFALNSLGNTNSVPITDVQHSAENQLQQTVYQHSYEDGSMHSSVHHNNSECGSRFHHEQPHYSDYLTDNATDHYENPNFDLINSESAASANGLLNNTNSGGSVNKKFGKTSTTSTTALSSNESNCGSHSASAASAVSQQQMLLLQSDACYSEPCQQNYEFNNFERPKFHGTTQKPSHENWSDSRIQTMFNNKREQKKSFNTLDRCGYDKPERRSENSAYSCKSNPGHDQRYPTYNSFERGSSCNGVRKSETFNNIAGNTTNAIHGRNASSSSAASSTSCGPRASSGVQTLTTGERHNHHNFQSHSSKGPPRATTNNVNQRTPNATHVADIFGRPFERASMKTSQNSMVNGFVQKQQLQHYSDEDENDMMLAGSNIECTYLINNEDGSCITSSNIIKSTLNPDEVPKILGNLTDFQFLPHQTNLSGMMPTAKKLALAPIYFSSSNHPTSLPSSPINIFGLTRNKQHLSSFEPSRHACAANGHFGYLSRMNSGTTPISYLSDSAHSSSMLVAEHGFVRFRPLDNINNSECIGIKNASSQNNDQVSK
uniref:Proline-rich transmembrane protein 3/4 domain-containing protein n=1 Tax=Glossina palpalis gambiensis TaxID=67801 RepID=A0A1B0BF20_9MUSC